MEIIYGSEVEDKNGKVVGTVNNIVRDGWTGDIRKFSVKTELADTDVFYAPEDVSESSETKVKLKIAFS